MTKISELIAIPERIHQGDFVLKGMPYQPTLESLPDEAELREQVLPAQEDWEQAGARAGALLGLTAPRTLNAASLARVVEEITARAREIKPVLDRLSTDLARRIATYVPAGTSARITGRGGAAAGDDPDTPRGTRGNGRSAGRASGA